MIVSFWTDRTGQTVKIQIRLKERLIRVYTVGYLSCLISKLTKWHVCPVKTQISLGLHPVWPESSQSAWRKLGSLATQWVQSKDSDQTGLMPRLIWVFAGHTCHFVGFVMRRLISHYSMVKPHCSKFSTITNIFECQNCSDFYIITGNCNQ